MAGEVFTWTYTHPTSMPIPENTAKREFLNIHIYDNPKCVLEKEFNKVARAKANVIRAERALQFLNDHFELTDRSAAKKSFFAYFELKA